MPEGGLGAGGEAREIHAKICQSEDVAKRPLDPPGHARGEWLRIGRRLQPRRRVQCRGCFRECAALHEITPRVARKPHYQPALAERLWKAASSAPRRISDWERSPSAVAQRRHVGQCGHGRRRALGRPWGGKLPLRDRLIMARSARDVSVVVPRAGFLMPIAEAKGRSRTARVASGFTASSCSAAASAMCARPSSPRAALPTSTMSTPRWGNHPVAYGSGWCDGSSKRATRPTRGAQVKRRAESRSGHRGCDNLSHLAPQSSSIPFAHGSLGYRPFARCCTGSIRRAPASACRATAVLSYGRRGKALIGNESHA